MNPLPDGMTTSAPSAGTVKLFSGEFSQKDELDHGLETKHETHIERSSQQQEQHHFSN